MKATALGPLLLAGLPIAAAHNVLHMDIQKPNAQRTSFGPRLVRRAKTVAEPLGNEGSLYYANVTIGTPPQAFQLQVDTGSSDVWVVQKGDRYCSQLEQGVSPCVGGQYDPTASKSYKLVDQGGFQISYVDQTGAQGDFFTDNFAIGPSGSATSVTGLQMGLATNTTIGTGIIGVGFAADESVCAQSSSSSSSSSQCKTYPTLTQMLVSQGAINSQAYSLWLNDLDANTGSILFGGIDTAKFMGQLITLPIQPDSSSNTITSFTVAWTNLTLGTPGGGAVTGFIPNNFVSPAILDSGTSLTLLPNNIVNKVYAEFGAVYSREAQGYIASCSLASSTATFDFQFGGPSGPTIRVPVNEFLLPLTNDDGSPATSRNGQQICQLGIEAANDDPILFGDTFLRSAYVVYDLDNRQISLAQTRFNVTDSNVLEIKSGSTSNVPSVAATATGAAVQQTKSSGPLGIVGSIFGGGGSSGATATAVANGGALSSQLAAAGTNAPLAQYTAANSNSPQAGGSGRGATSTAAAAPGAIAPRLRGEGVWMTALLMGAAGLGSAVLLL